MIEPIKSLAGALPTNADGRNGGGGDAAAQAPSASAAAKPAAQPQPAADTASAPSTDSLRLVVEPAGGGVGYTYKLFDRATGALVMELPREAADKLGESPDYTAGQVISAKA